MYVGKGADTAEGLCSVLEIRRKGKDVRLYIAQYGDSSPESETSSLGLALWFPSQISDIILREILHRFPQLKHSTDKSLEYSERVNALFSWLVSLPDLKKLGLAVSCLTEIWATRILKLIHSCPSLKKVWFTATVLDGSFKQEEGLLLDKGICLLQKAQRLRDCTIRLKGKRCCKATEPCTEFKDRILSCNELQVITLEKEDETEYCVLI